MDLHTTADYLAAHALMMLLIATVLLALSTAALWRMAISIGPRIFQWIASAWRALLQRPAAVRVRSMPLVDAGLNRTLSVGRYLGIHALLSFGVALVATIVFFELAEEIGFDEELARFDKILRSALAQHLSNDLLAAAAVLTHLGDSGVLIVVGAMVAGVLFWRREQVLAWAWIVTTVGGGLLNRLLKMHFARSRPAFDHDFTSVSGWSFPSGHASGSMLVYGLLGYLIVRHTRAAWHVPTVLVTMVLVVLIGSSRVLLQVHFLSDVLAGWVSAAAWMALCISGLETVRRRSAAELQPSKL